MKSVRKKVIEATASCLGGVFLMAFIINTVVHQIQKQPRVFTFWLCFMLFLVFLFGAISFGRGIYIFITANQKCSQKELAKKENDYNKDKSESAIESTYDKKDDGDIRNVDFKYIINGNTHYFKHKVSKVIKYKDTYIVLLEIPEGCNEINNIYCLDKKANIKWQSEDLNIKYPKYLKLPYVSLRIKDDIVYANDFFCRRFEINAENGKILGYTIVK